MPFCVLPMPPAPLDGIADDVATELVGDEV